MIDQTNNKNLDAEEKTRLKATASNKNVHDKMDVKAGMSDVSEQKTKVKSRPNEQTTSPIQNNDEQETRINPGAVLRNRFDLLEVIGQGGMGKVYKALDKRDIEAGDTKFIAIKIINDEYKDDANLLKALHAETRKTQSLAHPNIVTVYDFDRDGDTVFMTMEYIEGIPLDKVIKAESRGMSVEDVYPLISQIGSALIYAHSRHIIHLDLKPSNVFMDANKNIKVFDFGISRVTNIFQAKGFDAGVLGGLTPSYASLEMFEGEPPDPRDDIYALACLTYELLTGRHPYNRQPADTVKKKKLKPKKTNKLSANQWKTLVQALALNRKDRINSVELFLQGMIQQKSKKPLTISVFLLAGLLTFSYYLYSQYKDTTRSDKDDWSEEKKTTATEVPTKNPESHVEQPVTVDIVEPESDDIDKTKEVIIIEPEPSIVEQSDDITLLTNQQIFQIGDTLVFEFTVKKPMFVSIAVINSEGKVSMLFPNPYQLDNYCKVGVKYQVPPLDADFDINIEGPVGTDQVIAVIGDQSISDDLLMQFDNLESIKKYASQMGFRYAVTNFQIID
jgi:serine/threonine protein kinase